ncbi:MAG: type III pantothenate kinase [Fimbriimonadales bacterium]|nr:MAG: type III pantothenate kinase [Fimbriimonadales bacterium]
MLLGIDVGNTHTVLGVYELGRWHAWRVHTNAARTEDEHYILLRTLLGAAGLPEAIEGVAICSVVPALEEPLRQMARRWLHLEPLFVSPQLDLGFQIAYEPPSAVGADRLANAVAGVDWFGKPVIVVDFGTATTLDAVSRQGVYVGGAILPGIELMLESLAGRTARLPRIALEGACQPIGASTPESLRSGVMLGSIGAIEHLINLFKRELGDDAQVVATGGLAERLAPHCPSIQRVEPMLTLEGLRILWERHSKEVL